MASSNKKTWGFRAIVSEQLLLVALKTWCVFWVWRCYCAGSVCRDICPHCTVRMCSEMLRNRESEHFLYLLECWGVSSSSRAQKHKLRFSLQIWNVWEFIENWPGKTGNRFSTQFHDFKKPLSAHPCLPVAEVTDTFLTVDHLLTKDVEGIPCHHPSQFFCKFIVLLCCCSKGQRTPHFRTEEARRETHAHITKTQRRLGGWVQSLFSASKPHLILPCLFAYISVVVLLVFVVHVVLLGVVSHVHVVVFVLVLLLHHVVVAVALVVGWFRCNGSLAVVSWDWWHCEVVICEALVLHWFRALLFVVLGLLLLVVVVSWFLLLCLLSLLPSLLLWCDGLLLAVDCWWLFLLGAVFLLFLDLFLLIVGVIFYFLLVLVLTVFSLLVVVVVW